MKVVLADVEPESLDREAMRLADAGADVLGVACDVRDPRIGDNLRQLAREFGRLSFCFHEKARPVKARIF